MKPSQKYFSQQEKIKILNEQWQENFGQRDNSLSIENKDFNLILFDLSLSSLSFASFNQLESEKGEGNIAQIQFNCCEENNISKYQRKNIPSCKLSQDDHNIEEALKSFQVIFNYSTQQQASLIKEVSDCGGDDDDDYSNKSIQISLNNLQDIERNFSFKQQEVLSNRITSTQQLHVQNSEIYYQKEQDISLSQQDIWNKDIENFNHLSNYKEENLYFPSTENEEIALFKDESVGLWNSSLNEEESLSLNSSCLFFSHISSFSLQDQKLEDQIGFDHYQQTMKAISKSIESNYHDLNIIEKGSIEQHYSMKFLSDQQQNKKEKCSIPLGMIIQLDNKIVDLFDRSGIYFSQRQTKPKGIVIGKSSKQLGFCDVQLREENSKISNFNCKIVTKHVFLPSELQQLLKVNRIENSSLNQKGSEKKQKENIDLKEYQQRAIEVINKQDISDEDKTDLKDCLQEKIFEFFTNQSEKQQQKLKNEYKKADNTLNCGFKYVQSYCKFLFKTEQQKSQLHTLIQSVLDISYLSNQIMKFAHTNPNQLYLIDLSSINGTHISSQNNNGFELRSSQIYSIGNNFTNFLVSSINDLQYYSSSFQKLIYKCAQNQIKFQQKESNNMFHKGKRYVYLGLQADEVVFLEYATNQYSSALNSKQQILWNLDSCNKKLFNFRPYLQITFNIDQYSIYYQNRAIMQPIQHGNFGISDVDKSNEHVYHNDDCDDYDANHKFLSFFLFFDEKNPNRVFTIGRSTEADISINSGYLADFNTQIFYKQCQNENCKWVIQDLQQNSNGYSNNLWVNLTDFQRNENKKRKEIGPYLLQNNDVINCGGERIKIVLF